MKRKVLYVVLAAAVVLVVAGLLVLRTRQAGQMEEGVRSAVVSRDTMLVAVSASGSIEPMVRVGLAFERSGRVAELPVAVGDAVASGDALARLDGDQLGVQVEQSRAALASAEAQLARLQAGPRAEEIEAAEADLRAAEARLSGAAAGRDQLTSEASAAQIAAAEAEIASAELQQKSAQIAYDRIDKKDKDRKEQANYDLYAANEALAAAQAGLDQVLVGADADHVRAAQANVAVAAAQRDAVQSQLDLLLAGATAEQIAAAQAGVTQARAALEAAELSLEEATLRAPFDGIVAEVNVTAGERVAAGLPAVTLIDASEFRVIISVDELDVGRLTEGQSAQVTIDALRDVEIAGSVERMAPAATFDGGVVSYEVVIALARTDVPVRADMTANATIVVEELDDVLVIPTWVVRVDQSTGQTYVHRRAGDEFERVDVELGVRHQGLAQVLDGLSEGKEVVRLPESGPFDFGGGEG